MKLPYSTKKWEKEIKEAKAYDGITSTLSNINMLKKVYDSRNSYREKFQIRIEDEVTFYFLMGNEYETLSKYEYLMNNNTQKSFSFMIRFVELHSKAYSLYRNGADIKNMAVKKSICDDGFLTSLAFAAIAVDMYEMVSEYMDNSIIDYLYNCRYEAAREKMLSYQLEKDEDREVYFKDLCFLKNAILALTVKNEKAFKEELELRIRKYRKNMVGYSTFIDVVSVALIKIAKKAGIDTQIKVIEIPERFLMT